MKKPDPFSRGLRNAGHAVRDVLRNDTNVQKRDKSGEKRKGDRKKKKEGGRSKGNFAAARKGATLEEE